MTVFALFRSKKALIILPNSNFCSQFKFYKMNRKLNLKNIKKPQQLVGVLVESPNKLSAQNPKLSQSPFFSPIAHRTRKRKNEKEEKPQKIVELLLPAGPAKRKEEPDLLKQTSSAIDKPRKHHVKIEYDDKALVDESSSSCTEKDSKKKAKKHSIDENNATSSESTIPEKQEKWEPKNWWAHLNNIREMRKAKDAPVDTMGCHKCSDMDTDKKTQRFHHLIALMLSSQTKDGVTYDAMGRLKKLGLTPQKMVEIDAADLEQILCPVSFYKTKAKSIKKTSQILIDSFESDIPSDIKGLISLPGVGPKMAHICMRVAWNEVTGIGVDTHVHRIVNRLKWLPKETKEPEQTRISLEKWLPFEYWTEINELLVGFGQTICTPTNPKCGECLNYDICPSRNGKKGKVSK